MIVTSLDILIVPAVSILELIQATTPYFEKNKVDSPRLTIELILAHVLQTTRMKLYLEFDRILTPQELDLLRPLVKKRAEGHPLQYVLGSTTFMGQTFRVTPDVLIPRPETEILLQTLIPKINLTSPHLLDIGTGSGIIAITLAKKFPELNVWGCDLSEKSLTVAQSNAESLPNLHWHQGDLLTHPPVTQAQWVIANLPYIPTSEISQLTPEVQKEPLLALDGGTDGLDLIRRLIPQAAKLHAHLALEIWHTQALEIKSLLEKNGYSEIQVIQDFRQLDRIIMAHRDQTQNTSPP